MNTSTTRAVAANETSRRAGLVAVLGPVAARFLPSGRKTVIGIPFLWLTVFFALPFVLVLKISFADLRLGIPPYTNLVEVHDNIVHLAMQLGHYALLLQDDLYVATYINSLKMAAISTLLCLVIGYPISYYIARSAPATRNLLMMAVMLPFWTSFLIRVYAWIGILKDDGLLNHALMVIGLIHTPLRLYHSNAGVYIGMVYSYLPFMVMPLYAHLVKMDLTLLEAAYDLGAKPWVVFTRITLPLSRNGIIAGSLLVFIPAVGEYVIPELLGGADTLMLGRVMWDEFFNNMDWPMASAVTVAMVMLLLLPMAVFQYYQVKELEEAQ
ncbi:ABC transporter permease subunit [Paraburkholderia domus]|nr:ABC transporter permease subunit [Paraburkholderia domus]MBK5053128.1 ABC transporter permease subunit [Burkholderia sp. R-70006]MBK5065081.1 ABC transporter permease subunit [Burkholderia sp. R-70199]MBK5090255.1 ABC transporter permease subunit [Burkholderia sp. R-69927]MBK5124756.1 ABC transporter permease subunit [Burkholderia sp. R-69980]MBK5169006.1 ABC transporter permease subunit [Burkholderia sp. R-70211]MBK5184211.1 ABC transporter permease subunit [Burkholderia sp. R-69749]